MRRPSMITALVAAGALVLAGCGDDDDDEVASSDGGGLSGPGVTEETITLGVLTDKSGPFKDFGTNLEEGREIWLDDINAAGGICDREVVIDVLDHGYKTDQAVIQFADLEPDVAGFYELLGSPMIAALKTDIDEAEVSTVAISWSSFNLDQPYVMIAGTTYDLEIINGLSYLLEEGEIKKGDTIGHIYIDGEYGGNGLEGSKYFAEQHDMKVVEAKVTSTDSDMTSIVTGFKGDGVDVIALTSTPSQTASAAAKNKSLGLDVPMIGNNPVFAPQLLDGPAADSLGNLHIAASAVPFSSDVAKAQDIKAKYDEKYPDGVPSFAVDYGYALGVLWEAILGKACDSGDLSRAGIHAAMQASDSIDTEKLIADLDFSQAGSPSTREVYIAVADKNEPGGLKQIKPLFVSKDAESYKAPHEGHDMSGDGEEG